MPSGEEVDLASLARAWVPASPVPGKLRVYGDNPKLTALLPRLKVRIANSQEAEDVARIILGVFQGRGDLFYFKAERSENGWHVTPHPHAAVIAPPEFSVDLITVDGVLHDVREPYYDSDVDPREFRSGLRQSPWVLLPNRQGGNRSVRPSWPPSKWKRRCMKRRASRIASSTSASRMSPIGPSASIYAVSGRGKPSFQGRWGRMRQNKTTF